MVVAVYVPGVCKLPDPDSARNLIVVVAPVGLLGDVFCEMVLLTVDG